MGTIQVAPLLLAELQSLLQLLQLEAQRLFLFERYGVRQPRRIRLLARITLSESSECRWVKPADDEWSVGWIVG
jgi:hypothetical protein